MIIRYTAFPLQGATELVPRIAACLAVLPGAAVHHGARFEGACVRLTNALQQLMQLPALEEPHRAQLSSGVKALLEVVVERSSRSREVEQGAAQKEEGKDGAIAGLRRALLQQSQAQVRQPSNAGMQSRGRTEGGGKCWTGCRGAVRQVGSTCCTGASCKWRRASNSRAVSSCTRVSRRWSRPINSRAF